jgi:hypothetical protein
MKAIRFVILWAVLLPILSKVAIRAAQDPAPTDPVFICVGTDGSRLEGRIARLDAQGLVLKPDSPPGAGGSAEAVERPWSSLVALTRRGGEPPAWPPAGSVVMFPDGDCLRAIIGPATDTSLSLLPQSLGDASTPVPLDAPLAIVFAPPAESEAAAELLHRLRTDPRTSEVLWLANGDRLAGSLLAIGGSAVKFSGDAGEVEIPRSSVTAIAFAPELAHYPRPDGTFLELSFQDGSRLGVTDPHLDRGAIAARTRFGAPVRAPLSTIARIDARGPHVESLSDRAEAAVQYQGYLGDHPGVYGRDATWDGQPLRVGRRPYHRGLGMLPRSLVAYRLQPGDARFQAEIALDDTAGPRGNVVFRVLVDSKERFASPEIERGHAPIFVDVDLTGAKLLILSVEFGAGGDVQDSADWLDARIIRSKPE